MIRRFSLLIALAALALPQFASAAGKPDEIKELQRDVAVLQDLVKQLQQTQDKKFADLLTATQQAVESAGRANSAIAAIQTSLQQSLRTQDEKVVAPVVGLSTRMDTVTSELRSTEENLSGLSSQLTKILAMLDDMSKAIKVIQMPPPPAPDSGGGSSPQPGGGSASAAPAGQPQPPANPGPPPTSSSDMYHNALNDYQGGNLDMALTEFADYLKYFEKGVYASNAQYYIGMVHYTKQDYATAKEDFDTVLERYPDSANKNADARYYKGLSLLRLGKKTEAGAEFRDLIVHHRNDPNAPLACKQMEALALHCPAPPAPATKKSARK